MPKNTQPTQTGVKQPFENDQEDSQSQKDETRHPWRFGVNIPPLKISKSNQERTTGYQEQNHGEESKQ